MLHPNSADTFQILNQGEHSLGEGAQTETFIDSYDLFIKWCTMVIIDTFRPPETPPIPEPRSAFFDFSFLGGENPTLSLD